MEVYKAISAVQSALAKTGLEKAQKNTMQNYKFRGIDDVYNAVTPLLVEHGLCVLPRIVSREATERNTKNGGVMVYALVRAEFDFVAVADGSKYTVSTYGEAMDSGDKATNKAMSAAYKYAAIMTFGIPTEGDNDTENHTHELAAAPAQKPEWSAEEWAKTLPKLVKGLQVGKTINAALAWANGVARVTESQEAELRAAAEKLSATVIDVQATAPKGMSYAQVADAIAKAETPDALDAAWQQIEAVAGEDLQAELRVKAADRLAAINE